MPTSAVGNMTALGVLVVVANSGLSALAPMPLPRPFGASQSSWRTRLIGVSKALRSKQLRLIPHAVRNGRARGVHQTRGPDPPVARAGAGARCPADAKILELLATPHGELAVASRFGGSRGSGECWGSERGGRKPWRDCRMTSALCGD